MFWLTISRSHKVLMGVKSWTLGLGPNICPFPSVFFFFKFDSQTQINNWYAHIFVNKSFVHIGTLLSRWTPDKNGSQPLMHWLHNMHSLLHRQLTLLANPKKQSSQNNHCHRWDDFLAALAALYPPLRLLNYITSSSIYWLMVLNYITSADIHNN